MTDGTDVMSVLYGTAVIIRDVYVSDYHKRDLFVIIEQIENPEILLRDVSFSYVTSLCVSFHMFGFD